MTKHNMSATYWNINSDYKETKNVSEDKIFPVHSALFKVIGKIKIFLNYFSIACLDPVMG